MWFLFEVESVQFLLYLIFWWRFKDVELYFYSVFRSDPKLFTDDTDIKYCKALNCCKLPKVRAEINFVPFRRQISLLILVFNTRLKHLTCGQFKIRLKFVWRTTCVCKCVFSKSTGKRDCRTVLLKDPNLIFCSLKCNSVASLFS